jgi:hypothetical protein
VRQTFDRITSRFVEHAKRIIAEIRALAADLFAVDITPIIEVERFTTDSSHYYYIEDLFVLQLARLPPIAWQEIPSHWARRCIGSPNGTC